jgi:hypothetical protein
MRSGWGTAGHGGTLGMERGDTSAALIPLLVIPSGVEQPLVAMTSHALAIQVERRIYLIRGEKVMLDFDLAALYGVPTKSLNLAVKRNAARFPNDFMFQLTRAEAEGLRLQIGTSNESAPLGIRGLRFQHDLKYPARWTPLSSTCLHRTSRSCAHSCDAAGRAKTSDRVSFS